MHYMHTLNIYFFTKFATRAGSPQQHVSFTVGPYCLDKHADFREGGKPEYPEKNPRSTGEINNGNSLT